MKPQHRIMQDNPLIVYVTKQGRPVNEVSARAYVTKHWPHVVNWKLSRNDHSTVAEALLS